MNPYLQANLNLWNEWATLHANMRSEDFSYNLDAFRAGRSTLYPLDVGEVGDVAGKSLLHLQCHIGFDTLSWARLGATVTGADFSENAVGFAQRISDELGLGGRFVRANIYDLPAVLHETFDVVYTSYGVLSWLPDIPRWAEVAAHFVKPGGVFYIAEIHPIALVFDQDRADCPANLRPVFGYFHTSEPMAWPTEGSYADPHADIAQKVHYEWTYTLADVITSLAQAGLAIEFVHEFPFCCYPHFRFLERRDDHWWYMPDGLEVMPLTFTIRATKPAGQEAAHGR